MYFQFPSVGHAFPASVDYHIHIFRHIKNIYPYTIYHIKYAYTMCMYIYLNIDVHMDIDINMMNNFNNNI